jgi:hypothetical protein
MIAARSPIAANLHDFFRREGYLYLPGLVKAERCVDVLDEFAATVPEARHAAATSKYWRTGAARVRLASADRLLHSDELLAPLRNLLGSSVALVTNRHDHRAVVIAHTPGGL